MKIIDLHTHTAASDGSYTPNEIIDYAIEKGLSTIAITDHDTILGVKKAKDYITENNIKDIELIPGIEFSTTTQGLKAEIHIVGLFIDENNPDFNTKVSTILEGRIARNKKLVAKLNELGFDIDLEEVIREAGDKVITRAHFANILKDKGYVESNNEAFEKYLGYNGPAYIKREKLPTTKAIELINNCGGIPILAHPTLYNLTNDELTRLVEDLIDHGLKGIEAIYYSHTKEEEKHLMDLARKYNLLISGGSDFHGGNRAEVDLGVGKGNLKIPYELVEKMKETLR